MGNVQNNNQSNNINLHCEKDKQRNKYCNKCGRKLENDLYGLFCDSFCRSEYYLEIRQDMDDCFGEWIGRD